MHRTIIAVLGIFALYAAGCVRTVQPVLKDEQCITDDSLNGKWVTKDGDFVEVSVKDVAAKSYAVHYADKDSKTGEFIGRLGRVGDMELIEITPEDPAPANSDVYKAHLLPLHSFLLVQQTKPNLQIALLQPDWLKKYVDEHPGELAIIRPDKDNLIVTASTEEFQAFLTKHEKDEGFWGEPAIFMRPGNATTKP